jgi:hypothetical protein
VRTFGNLFLNTDMMFWLRDVCCVGRQSKTDGSQRSQCVYLDAAAEMTLGRHEAAEASRAERMLNVDNARVGNC